MKYKEEGLFGLNLQLFADDGAGNPDGGGTGNGGEPEPKGMSFDEFLKEGGNQAEFDRRTQKAITTALTKEREKWQAITDDKLSEAEKLAKMTKEEKSAYLQQKKEKELSDREAAITRKELMAEARNTLAEKNLPQELADVLNYTDADSCSKSINAAEKAFQKAVQKAVEERLKGKDPMKKAPESQTEEDKRIEALIMGR